MMQWLPDTIDALTRMLETAGVVGSITFLFAVTISLLLWRHLGQIIEVVKTGVTAKIAADATIIGLLSQQGLVLKDIAASNVDIKDRVGKLPSDVVVCGAKSTEELTQAIQTVMSAGGVALTEAETAMLVKHRQAIAQFLTREGGAS